jgi:glycerol uptake facilitator-like aquaporin
VEQVAEDCRSGLDRDRDRDPAAVDLGAVGGTVGLCALVGGPVSGASMNPARSLGPALAAGELNALWIYIVAPLLGAAIGAIGYQLVRGEPTSPAPAANTEA